MFTIPCVESIEMAVLENPGIISKAYYMVIAVLRAMISVEY
jgi:hypothetical protein